MTDKQDRYRTTLTKKNDPTVLESCSVIALAMAAIVALFTLSIGLLAAILMVGWGLLAPFFGMELLSFPVAVGIILVLMVIGWVIKR